MDSENETRQKFVKTPNRYWNTQKTKRNKQRKLTRDANTTLYQNYPHTLL